MIQMGHQLTHDLYFSRLTKKAGVTTIRMFNWQRRKTLAVDGRSFTKCKLRALFQTSNLLRSLTSAACSCPKCMEEANRDGDDQSVKSGRSLRSTSRKMEQPQTSSSTGGKSKKKWNLFKGSTGDQPQVDDDDDRSVKSNKSTRSNKSSRSTSKRGQAASSSRYGSMPFDGDGYCVQ